MALSAGHILQKDDSWDELSTHWDHNHDDIMTYEEAMMSILLENSYQRNAFTEGDSK